MTRQPITELVSMLVSESTTGMREAWHLDLGPFSLTCELDEEGEGLIGTGG